ncbi:MAG: transposase, partial [Eubacteriaceae bacterium]|nr:transposase [Eubacteriaceae bacterium]
MPRGRPAALHQGGQRHLALHKGVRQRRHKIFRLWRAGGYAPSELDRAASLRWPIEQRFQECKGFLGMPHYECRTLQGWRRHMLFVTIARLFVRSLQ